MSCVTSKSFYGKGKKKYLNPIDRKSISVLREKKKFENSNEASSTSSKTKSSLGIKKTRGVYTQKIKTCSPLPVQKIISQSASNPDSSKKKFFKHDSPGKKARRMGGASVIISKGFDMKFKPVTRILKNSTQNDKKVKTPTKRSRKCRASTAVLPNREGSPQSVSEACAMLYDNLSEEDSDNTDVSMAVHVGLFESPVKSTPLQSELSKSPDSVMLLSEMSTPSTPASKLIYLNSAALMTAHL